MIDHRVSMVKSLLARMRARNALNVASPDRWDGE
jgi:hypothetical protein